MTYATALSDVPRIGILGDLHGDLEHLLGVAKTMRVREVTVLLALGDFGFIWPRENWDNNLDKISRRLGAHGQSLYFVDGNHEWFPQLYKFPVAADGIRWVRPNIGHLPRGYRTVIGRWTLAALGGANSIDRLMRAEGHSWWPQESITETDLERLGTAPADILIGHDAPLHVPMLDQFLAETEHQWLARELAYASAGRAMFHRGFMQVRPRLSLSGHYHRHIDEHVTYDADATPFETRVVVMDMAAGPRRISQAVLDIPTLSLEYLLRDGTTVAAQDENH